MSLTKLFSFKYLKENLKKSKGILLLICMLVPVFTTLTVTFNFNVDYTRRVLSQYEISYINILGMFLVPILLSHILFGYVFKKNSVDLINSMPLKRRTIFVTNTIGGIAIITAIQVLTAVLLLLCNIFCKTIYIFPAMIWDVFLVMWLAYIFIFVAANIAMSVSGTFLTECAVTLLILFLVPFCIISFNKFDNDYNSKMLICDNGETLAQYTSSSEYRVFTMPASIIYNGLRNETLYISESLIRTLCLSIVYIFIGLKLFEKRKMENAEESFESNKVHLLIKALTMIPMICFVHYIGIEMGLVSIFYALIVFYFFAYDFIVKKKVALKYSIPALIVIVLCLEGICSFSDFIYDKIDYSKIKIDKNDIKEVALDFQNTYGYYSNNKITSYTKNKDVINTILEAEKEKNNGENSDWNKYISIKVKDKFNKEYSFAVTLNEEYMNKLIDTIDDEYVNKLKKDFIDDGVIGFRGYFINDENVSRELDDELKSLVMNMNKKEFFNFVEDKYTMNLTKATYKNHQLMSRTFSIDSSNKMLEIFAEYQNKKAINAISLIKSQVDDDNWYYGVSIENSLKNFESKSIYVDYGSYYFNYYPEEIIEFINQDKDTKFDSSKDYYIIGGNYNIGFNYYDFLYFTNNIDAVNEIVKKDIERTEEENVEYPEKGYYDDIKIVDNAEI